MDKHAAGFDHLVRFWLDTAPARGVVVRLEDSIANALVHHEYPPAVASLLRQLTGAAVLLASNLKQPAHIILQAQGDGDVPLLCVEASQSLTFRSYANIREGATTPDNATLKSLLAPNGEGRFIMTIAPEEGQMYQGIVALTDGSIASLLEEYLSNSQQTDTRLWLREDGTAIEAMMLERLPDTRIDADGSHAEQGQADWESVAAQAEVIFAEPFMPFPYAQWLGFMFSEHDVRVSDSHAVSFACSCSAARVMNALKLVGKAEIMSLIEGGQNVETECEFCGKHYSVSPGQITLLFSQADPEHHAPSTRTLQ